MAARRRRLPRSGCRGWWWCRRRCRCCRLRRGMRARLPGPISSLRLPTLGFMHESRKDRGVAAWQRRSVSAAYPWPAEPRRAASQVCNSNRRGQRSNARLWANWGALAAAGPRNVGAQRGQQMQAGTPGAIPSWLSLLHLNMQTPLQLGVWRFARVIFHVFCPRCKCVLSLCSNHLLPHPITDCALLRLRSEHVNPMTPKQPVSWSARSVTAST
jgi:hypothetical protein